MDEIHELIMRYGLGEDNEHVIIPLPDRDGLRRRCLLLKRRYIRIMYEERHYIDYPIGKIIEAIVNYPDLSLSEALHILYRETGEEIPERHDHEEEDTRKRDIP